MNHFARLLPVVLIFLAFGMNGCFFKSTLVNLDPTSEQTSPDEGSNLPTSLYVSAITYNSITLSWTQATVFVDSYKLVYQTGSTPPANCESGTSVSISNSFSNFQISSLLSNTNYSFRLCSVRNSETVTISEGSFISAKTLIAPPPQPTSFTATTASSSAIDLAWVSGAGTTHDFRISYQAGATAPADCQSGTLVNEASISGNSHQVTSLSPGTQYSFRVCAINANATADVSSGVIASATTHFALPVNPTGLTATPASDVQINLSWTSGGGGTTDYRISYQTGATAPATCANGTQISEAAVTGTSHNISALTASTQYSFRVCAINNNSPVDVSTGTTVTATTLATPQAAPPNPTGLSHSSLTDTSVQLSWTSGGGTTSDYRISYQTGATAPATCAAGTAISDSAISGTSHSISGLTANTQYSFRVCSINGNATPDVSSGITLTLTTLYAAPPNATSLTATPASDTQIDLSWSSGGGSTSDYRISYATGGSAPATCATGTQISEASVTGASHSVTGLTANTQYSFRVCAINANGTPDVSSGTTTTATTLQAAPPNASGLTATEAETQVQLSWTSGGGSTVDYRISYATGATAPATCAAGTTIGESSISGTSHTITGLTQGTLYSFRVCAINGNSTPYVSSGITVTKKTKILATGLRAIYTSEWGDSDFEFAPLWRASDSEIYGTMNGSVVILNAVAKTYTTVAIPGAIGADPTVSYQFKTNIGGITYLVFEITQYNPTYENYITALNTQTKTMEILIHEANVSFKIEFQNYIYLGYNTATDYTVVRSNGTAAGTTIVLSTPFTAQTYFLNANSNFLFFAYDPASTWDFEIYKLGPGASPTFTQVTNNCPAAACAGVLNSVSGFLTTLIGEDLIYTGYDGTNSILYKTDGTTSALLKTLGPSFVSIARSFRKVNSTYYIFDVEFDQGFWSTDGSAANTQKVTSDVSSTGMEIIDDGNYSYWTVWDSTNSALDLWKSDGTIANTRKLTINVAPINKNLVIMNGHIYYFSLAGGLGQELYKYNLGTDTESLVKDMNPGTDLVYGSWSSIYSPNFYKLDNNTILFTGAQNNQYELWKSDGTTAGTQLVKDINTYTNASSFPHQFFKLGSGETLFLAQSQSHGTELWVTDGTTAGTVEFANLNTSKRDTDTWGSIGYAREFGESSAFKTVGMTANNIVPALYVHPFRGEELFGLDVVNDTFTLVKEFVAGHMDTNASSSGGGISFVGNTFFFPSSPLSYGIAGYVENTHYYGTDGTLAGTVDVLGGLASYFDVVAAPSVAINGDQVIVPNWVSSTNTEFFNYNTTTKATSTVANVCPNYCAQTGYGNNRFGRINATKFVYRDADGNNIASDGTAGGTAIFAPQLKDPYFQKGYIVNGTYVFLGGYDGIGFGLFTTDGTTGGTSPLKIFDATWDSTNFMGAFENSFISGSNDQVYVVVSSSWVGFADLYVTDGTALGTKLVKSFNAATYGIGSVNLIENDPTGRALVNVYDVADNNLRSIWITDPVGLTLTKLFDASVLAAEFPLTPIKIANNTVYGTSENKLFSLNLSTLAITPLHNAGNTVTMQKVCYRGNRIYFPGWDATNGAELWYTDGTVAGTQLWQDSTAGAGSTTIRSAIQVGNKCYFWGKTNASDNPKIFVLDF